MALTVVCLGSAVPSPVLRAQTLGAAAAAAAKQRQATQAQPPAPAAGEKSAAEPAAAATDQQKTAGQPESPAREPAKPPARKVYTEADLPGNSPEDRARAAEAKKLDGRYDDLLTRLQALDAKMKQDVKAARNAEMELKLFKLDMANRNKYEQRQALEKDLADKRGVVQQNLVVLERLRAEQRVLDAELARLQEPR